MDMMWVQPFDWVRKIYPNSLWRLATAEKQVALTFDDGPTPEVTAFVLEQLALYHFKATFFLIGKNAALFPQIAKIVCDSGHSIGNHTFHHVNGWKVSYADYLKDFHQAHRLFKSNLFRPPYGKITRKQAQAIAASHQLIFWDILTYDYHPRVSAAQCFQYVKQYTRPGSIITFHDSVKAWPNLKKALPDTLQWLADQGYQSIGL